VIKNIPIGLNFTNHNYKPFKYLQKSTNSYFSN